jgi:HSP20 family molecular chaperone IbpA
VDIYETDKELILTSDTPGIRLEDVELRYEQGKLLLHGRIQARERNAELMYQEYEEGDFLALPFLGAKRGKNTAKARDEVADTRDSVRRDLPGLVDI